jgi:dTDP-4-dehydrorhamnose 3,5-epimerase
MTAPQFRLVRCTVGEVWDVVADLRVGSPTFGRWLGVSLSGENKKQLLIAPEFAHAFVVLSEFAEVQYKCTGHHTPSAEHTLAWNDPDIGVPWPVKDPILSKRDMGGMSLRDYLKRPAFKYAAEAIA